MPVQATRTIFKPAFYLRTGDSGVSFETPTCHNFQIATFMQACFEAAGYNKPLVSGWGSGRFGPSPYSFTGQ